MSTSGTITFTQARDQIVRGALIKLGVLGLRETIQAEDSITCTDALNRMVKSWAVQGPKLWCIGEAKLFPDVGVYNYSLGSTATHASADYITTSLATAAPIAATYLTLDDTTGMTIGDYIGINTDSNTRHWTTIATLPGFNAVTITDALPVAASADNIVYTYTTPLEKPLELFNVRRQEGIGVEKPLRQVARKDYMRLTNKEIDSDPAEYYFSYGNSVAQLYLWPGIGNIEKVVNFSYHRQIQDFNIATDNADFPVEWLDCLIYNLASNLLLDYSVGGEKAVMVNNKAAETLMLMKDFDEEDADLLMVPNNGE